jgi:hypothetical protein
MRNINRLQASCELGFCHTRFKLELDWRCLRNGLSTLCVGGAEAPLFFYDRCSGGIGTMSLSLFNSGLENGG